MFLLNVFRDNYFNPHGAPTNMSTEKKREGKLKKYVNNPLLNYKIIDLSSL